MSHIIILCLLPTADEVQKVKIISVLYEICSPRETQIYVTRQAEVCVGGICRLMCYFVYGAVSVGHQGKIHLFIRRQKGY